jgi:hypothetical protein
MRTAVLVAGQAALPVWRQEREGVPAFVAPGVRDLAPLEDDVIDGALCEKVAGRETAVPRADDDRRDVFDDLPPRGPGPSASLGAGLINPHEDHKGHEGHEGHEEHESQEPGTNPQLRS